uniref:Synaptonemal complex central element protein 2 n=1 Tax=Pelusios castaneus TaxID=367368 RepID=A0A8C8SRH3_9SAUR
YLSHKARKPLPDLDTSVTLIWKQSGSFHHESSNSSEKEGPNTSVLCPTADAPVAVLDGKSSSYFAALDSNIENLQKRTQQLIEKINENRKKDHTVMSNFRDSLLLKVSSLAEKLEEMMFLIYDCHNKQMQDKLQELSEIMERISQNQTELRQVCHTVEAAYKDLCKQPEVWMQLSLCEEA